MFSIKIKRALCMRLIAVSMATCLVLTLLQSSLDTSDVSKEEQLHVEFKTDKLGQLTEVDYVKRRENLNLAHKRAALEEKRLPRHVRSHLKDHDDQMVKISFSAPEHNRRESRDRPSEAVFYEARSGRTRETLITERNDTANKWIWGQDISKQCGAKKYNLNVLPKASVIISFHENENLSHLLRTLHSIVRRTPETLLEEIILINDNSHKEDHEMILQNYITAMFKTTKIRLLFTHDSLGLIRARLSGVRLAKGEVIVSMDSHMEVQDRWLEPLLAVIEENPRTLATSYLDWMEIDNDDTWVYKHGPSTWKTYFDWSLVFGFQDSTKEQIEARKADVTAPVVSPVTIGTIWAMRKEVFEEIGAFDDQMEGWGGENLDLPIRLWMCGGRVLNIPCSHAGHLEQQGHRDYRKTWVSKTNRNYKRVAEVWLDDYKKYFYYYHPEILGYNAGDLSSRIEIKERCFNEYGRNFSWFLKDVFPELGIPGGADNLAWDGIQNLAFNACLTVIPPNKPTLQTCIGQAYTQGFYWDTSGHLRFPVHIFNAKRQGKDYHLDTGEYISMHGSKDLSQWIHWQNGWLMWYPMNLCLHAISLKDVQLAPCDHSDPKQRWSFRRYTRKFSNFAKSVVKLPKLPQNGAIALNKTTLTEVFEESTSHKNEAFLQALAENIRREYT